MLHPYASHMSSKNPSSTQMLPIWETIAHMRQVITTFVPYSVTWRDHIGKLWEAHHNGKRETTAQLLLRRPRNRNVVQVEFSLSSNAFFLGYLCEYRHQSYITENYRFFGSIWQWRIQDCAEWVRFLTFPWFPDELFRCHTVRESSFCCWKNLMTFFSARTLRGLRFLVFLPLHITKFSSVHTRIASKIFLSTRGVRPYPTNPPRRQACADFKVLIRRRPTECVDWKCQSVAVYPVSGWVCFDWKPILLSVKYIHFALFMA